MINLLNLYPQISCLLKTAYLSAPVYGLPLLSFTLDTEKKIDDRVQLIDQAEKYLKHRDTYKAYAKLRKNKQDTFYNEHTAEIILFESAKKYLKEHLGEKKTLNISKWKSEIGTLRKEKDILYSQMTDIRKEVEQAESVRGCIDKLLQEKRGLTQEKKKELEV